PDLQQHVLEKFAYSLYHSGGYLFLGQAETVRPSQTNYELINKKWKIYRCVLAPQPTAREQGSARSPISYSRPTPASPNPDGSSLTQTSRAAAEIGSFRRFNEHFLR